MCRGREAGRAQGPQGGRVPSVGDFVATSLFLLPTDASDYPGYLPGGGLQPVRLIYPGCCLHPPRPF